MVKKDPVLVAAILCLLALGAQTTLAMRTKAPTGDEFAHHIASGYSYLVTRDFRMNPASPPLPRMLAGLPLFFLGAKAPLDHESWDKGDSPAFAKQFFEVANTRQDEFVFWARFPIVLLSLIFGGAVFWWSRTLWGNIGALASIALYSFCPDILAHSALATADLAVSLFFFLTLVFFYRYLVQPSPKKALICGLFAGLALLSKFSAVLIFPILLLVAAAGGKLRELSWRRIVLFFTAAFLTVWAGYFFEMKPLLENTPAPEKKIAEYQRIGGDALVRFAEKVPVPLSTFSSALVSMVYTRAAGTNAYLLGEWSREGWWYYYIVAFCVKNTIPSLILLLISIFTIGRMGISRTLAAVLIVPIIFFFIFTLGDKAQAGIRYFLPIYPLFFVLSGGAAGYLWKKGRFLKGLVLVLLSWHAVEALRIFPDHFSYFNQLAGGPPNGYRILRDSNIDWGQDLKGLGVWTKKNGDPEIALFYPWPANPSYYRIRYRSLRPNEFLEPERALYAVSVHALDNVAWTRERKPDAMIGYSLFIYDLR